MNNKIFLIVPPNRSYNQRMPLGIMSISAYLTSKKEENVILDFKGISKEKAEEKIKEKIIKEKPKFIGITCLVSELEIVKELCSFVKNNLKDSIIVIGGPHASICPEHFQKKAINFDYLIIGEGEETFYELISAIKKGDTEKVKGIAYPRNNKLIITDKRGLIKNLDNLPFPDYDKVDMEYYCRPNVWAIRPIYLSSFSIFTSRGCPYSCKFCVAHTIFGRQVRFRSAKSIAKHIGDIVKKYKIDALYFADESFTVSKERVYSIFNILKKNKVKIIWGCQTRVNLLDEKLLRFMKKNGCIQVDFGIESGSDKMLKIMNKQTSLKNIIEIGKICKKIKLRQLANMLINIPNEELGDIEKSIWLVNKIKYNLVLWNVYTPFPGVSFGKKIDLKDLNIMLEYPSKKTFDLLEKKYKFGNYDISLEKILDNLYSKTFHPKYVKNKLSWGYLSSVLRTFSFIFELRYWIQILKSKRKKEYFSNLFNQKKDY